jgi:cbb3-type cytochrome oxidase subunit 3
MMKELVSALSPAHYTEIALALFVAVWVAVAIRHSSKRRRAEHDACAQLPLADDAGDLR